MTNGSDPGDDGRPEPAFVLLAGTVIYGLMGAAALGWLWLRDRGHMLFVQAIGEHGPLMASGVGLLVGVVAASLMRRFASFGELVTAVERVIAGAGPSVGIAFSLIAALAEELFFRLAVQDALGLVGSVAAYVLLNSTVGGLRWLVFATLHALVLGSIVHFGFGLLGSTTAHAILNHLTLRRIQD